MKRSHQAALALVGTALTVGGTASAVQPPDIVQSDSSGNTAMGASAMLFEATGAWNTAVGYQSLTDNTSGSLNTATGSQALAFNSGGYANSAFGEQALYDNMTGSFNSAVGSSALNYNSTGSGNSAFGNYAASGNTTGNNNTAVGYSALSQNSTGTNNTAIGWTAGNSLTTGGNNIDIANAGAAGESGTIRIGTLGQQTATYIAGINSATVTGPQVFITRNGQLGILASSERYKTAIAPMGSSTAQLEQLRPVTFHLKADPQGALQYGLIAEEVDRVYPELVIRDAAGVIEGVRYDELAPMLLNEVQEQKAEVGRHEAELTAQEEWLALLAQKTTAQNEKLAAQGRQLNDMQQNIAKLEELGEAMRVALQGRQSEEPRVAQR